MRIRGFNIPKTILFISAIRPTSTLIALLETVN
jgi:hypothetical protein